MNINVLYNFTNKLQTFARFYQNSIFQNFYIPAQIILYSELKTRVKPPVEDNKDVKQTHTHTHTHTHVQYRESYVTFRVFSLKFWVENQRRNKRKTS